MGCAGPGAKTSPANTLNLRTAGNDMDSTRGIAGAN